MNKISLEQFFEQKYSWIENYIRETKGDQAYDRFLDALLDWKFEDDEALDIDKLKTEIDYIINYAEDLDDAKSSAWRMKHLILDNTKEK